MTPDEIARRVAVRVRRSLYQVQLDGTPERVGEIVDHICEVVEREVRSELIEAHG